MDAARNGTGCEGCSWLCPGHQGRSRAAELCFSSEPSSDSTFRSMAGKAWAQFKGSRFPAVAVRDLAIQPRITISSSPHTAAASGSLTTLRRWRALTPTSPHRKRALFRRGPVSSNGFEGNGGWSNGDAVFIGDNPPDAAVITYYQKARHLFGKLKLEVLDASGQVIDELPASKRPGLNRVSWSMQEKPPRVPPAAQIAFDGIHGARLVPGTYTVRLTKNGKALRRRNLPSGSIGATNSAKPIAKRSSMRRCKCGPCSKTKAL